MPQQRMIPSSWDSSSSKVKYVVHIMDALLLLFISLSTHFLYSSTKKALKMAHTLLTERRERSNLQSKYYIPKDTLGYADAQAQKEGGRGKKKIMKA